LRARLPSLRLFRFLLATRQHTNHQHCADPLPLHRQFSLKEELEMRL
jgi:hypothetical protein